MFLKAAVSMGLSMVTEYPRQKARRVTSRRVTRGPETLEKAVAELLCEEVRGS